MSGVNEIWNPGNSHLTEEQLMAYLEGKLSAEQQRQIEYLLSEEGMDSDAIEGLKELAPENTAHSVQKLNKQLRSLTHKRKRRTGTLTDYKWTWLAIFIVLLLCVLGYAVLQEIGK